MRALSQLARNKSAVSTIVAYVLLISISVGLSVMVYNWLKFYVGEEEVPQCPNGVNLIIKDYECVSGASGYLNITFKNKGRFTVDGFFLRVHDRADADFGFHSIDDEGVEVEPGGEYNENYPFADILEATIDTVTVAEVQPFQYNEEGKLACKSHSLQEISCS